ncbi:MAG: hypothetical protein ACI9SD_001718 [Pseudohongiellaceae bacterium]|jgi:hypothetical protein
MCWAKIEVLFGFIVYNENNHPTIDTFLIFILKTFKSIPALPFKLLTTEIFTFICVANHLL